MFYLLCFDYVLKCVDIILEYNF